MKIYGTTEIARTLHVDAALVSKWRERNKLPPADAELSSGPVWLAETIEPFLKAGRPAAKPRGGPLSLYVVSARMKTGRFPPIGSEDQERFTEAITGIRSRALFNPTVTWTGAHQAEVKIGCMASEPVEAGSRVRTIIMRQAQSGAHIGVKDVEIEMIKRLDDW